MSRPSLCAAFVAACLAVSFAGAQPKPPDKGKGAPDKAKADKMKAKLDAEKAKEKARIDAEKAKEKAKPPEKPPEPEPPPPPPADEPKGLPSPLRLVQGLREQGLADLAVEYLDGLDPAKLADPDERAAIPLERANCKLALAAEETEDAAKAGLLGEARSELQAFRKANLKHPRVSEAVLSLARLTNLDAKAQLQKAVRTRDKERRAAEKLVARNLMTEAAKYFADGAKALAARLDNMADSGQKRALERERVQAELAGGINLYNLYDTFPSDEDATNAIRLERAKALDSARKVFDGVANGPSNSPTAWIAKAWVAECDQRQDRTNEAKAESEDIKKALGSAPEAGRRLLGYFEVRRAFDQANDAKGIADMQAAAKAWLQKYDSIRRPSTEAVHVKYLLAQAIQGEVRNAMTARAPKPPAPHKFVDPTPTERGKLQQCERLLRDVAQTENDYTERANDNRTNVVRLLIGETIKTAKEYARYDDAHMAALVQQSKLRDAEKADPADPAKVKAATDHLVALLERARALAAPTDSAGDVAVDQLRLAAMYLSVGRTYEAAVLGEHMARAEKPVPGRTATAGALAVAAYLNASAKVPAGAAGDEARKADRDRAVRVGRYIDERFPADGASDDARYRLGYLFFSEGKLPEAFDLLSRVRPGFPKIVDGRLLEGLIASQLLVSSGTDSLLTDPARRLKVYTMAVADLERVPAPAPDATSKEARDYFQLRTRLCLLHLLKTRVQPGARPSYDKARDVAVAMIADLPSFKGLTPEHRLESNLLALDLRTRAIYLQAAAMFEKGDYEPMFELLVPLLDEMDKPGSGPATAMTVKQADEGGQMAEKPLEGQLAAVAAGYDRDRRDVILLALKGRIRKGEVDEATKQLDRLEKFGGSIDTNISTLQQLLGEIRSQIVALRKDGKASEAKGLTDGFSQLIARVTGKPDMKPSVRLFAGQALLTVDQFAAAAAELEKVPAPSEEEWKQPFEGLAKGRQEAVRYYRAAALYRMRALRQAKLYPEADKLVVEVIGTAAAPRWGFNFSEYKKEAIHLLEAKAQDSIPGTSPAKLWGEAVQGWAKLGQVQQVRLKKVQEKQALAERRAAGAAGATVRAALAGFAPQSGVLEVESDVLAGEAATAKTETDKAKAIYFDLFFETQRCSLRAYLQVYKDKPDKVKDKFETEARKIVDLETKNADLAPEVRARYVELLDEMKGLKAAYQAAGGKMFLQKPEAAAVVGK